MKDLEKVRVTERLALEKMKVIETEVLKITVLEHILSNPAAESYNCMLIIKLQNWSVEFLSV